MGDLQVKKLLSYIEDLELIDLLGLANIVEVKPQEDFCDFVAQICFKFTQMPRKERREFLRLAQDVSKANKECRAAATKGEK